MSRSKKSTMHFFFFNIFLTISEFSGNAAVKKLRDLLDTEPSVKESENAFNLKDLKGDIRFNDVSFSYEDEIEVLKNISLHLEAGKTISFVGPTGAGKSTVLRTIYKDVPIADGRLYINGEDVSNIRRRHVPHFRRKIGIVFQDYRLIPDCTVFENIALPLQIEGETKKHIKDKVHGIIDNVGLTKRGNYYPSQLSGGEKQRVSIARALVKKPLVILADEPTGNLDPNVSD